MDEISTQLHAVVADPPPSGIDVDQLIRSERRRRRHRVRALSGTGIAAAVAAVLVTPALFAGNATPRPAAPPPPGLTRSAGPSSTVPLCGVVTPKPSGPPAPLQTYDTVRSRPTEPPADGVARLTAALRTALADHVDPGTTATGSMPACARPQFLYQDRYREYETIVALRSARGRSHLVVNLRPTAAELKADCEHAMDRRNCRVTRERDGTVLLSGTSIDPDGGVRRWAEVRRADGTSVTATVDNAEMRRAGEQRLTAPEPLLTLDRVVAIARAPGLTLYP